MSRERTVEELLEGGLEVEIGVAEPSWAATDPVDPGSRRVVTDGLRILHDPDGRPGRPRRRGGGPAMTGAAGRG